MYFVPSDWTNVHEQPRRRREYQTNRIDGMYLHLHRVDHRYLSVRHRVSYEHDSNLHVNHREERREILVNHAVEGP